MDYIHNNGRRSLGTEGSLSEAGTSPPHNSDTLHVPVAGLTATLILDASRGVRFMSCDLNDFSWKLQCKEQSI